MYKTQLVTGPTIEPITLTELRDHLHLSEGVEDDYLTGLISAARKQVERYLNRALITQTWKVFYDCWKNELLIPFPKLQSVTHIKYYNGSGTLTLLTETDYYWVVTTDAPGRIIRKYDAVYPEVQIRRPDAIEIQFVAGYGATAADVPEDIKQGIKIICGNLHANREDIVIGHVASKIPDYVTGLIHSYKIYTF